ncbi:uncharacterized protein MYCFIDRAFT_179714 [Pseudocercospora fijiensis CIRAD86]|uniref:Uncharacterized protein n=1 Tax=Pseudocercospora fijiensis (strain CIRAD86) TaxID=383855 RepID=M2YI96_PSEFD|nr:uncharacterized protein MYCFIDRAFT_179714 [Pseudocercospora fijiensis CIRAD86]EME77495.1 hypothetical protein MYCFIDRAFT_179714 [Pseudocercospora fijiensis CIRAD86]
MFCIAHAQNARWMNTLPRVIAKVTMHCVISAITCPNRHTGLLSLPKRPLPVSVLPNPGDCCLLTNPKRLPEAGAVLAKPCKSPSYECPGPNNSGQLNTGKGEPKGSPAFCELAVLQRMKTEESHATHKMSPAAARSLNITPRASFHRWLDRKQEEGGTQIMFCGNDCLRKTADRNSGVHELRDRPLQQTRESVYGAAELQKAIRLPKAVSSPKYIENRASRRAFIVRTVMPTVNRSLAQHICRKKFGTSPRLPLVEGVDWDSFDRTSVLAAAQRASGWAFIARAQVVAPVITQIVPPSSISRLGAGDDFVCLGGVMDAGVPILQLTFAAEKWIWRPCATKRAGSWPSCELGHPGVLSSAAFDESARWSRVEGMPGGGTALAAEAVGSGCAGLSQVRKVTSN